MWRWAIAPDLFPHYGVQVTQLRLLAPDKPPVGQMLFPYLTRRANDTLATYLVTNCPGCGALRGARAPVIVPQYPPYAGEIEMLRDLPIPMPDENGVMYLPAQWALDELIEQATFAPATRAGVRRSYDAYGGLLGDSTFDFPVIEVTLRIPVTSAGDYPTLSLSQRVAIYYDGEAGLILTGDTDWYTALAVPNYGSACWDCYAQTYGHRGFFISDSPPAIVGLFPPCSPPDSDNLENWYNYISIRARYYVASGNYRYDIYAMRNKPYPYSSAPPSWNQRSGYTFGIQIRFSDPQVRPVGKIILPPVRFPGDMAEYLYEIRRCANAYDPNTCPPSPWAWPPNVLDYDLISTSLTEPLYTGPYGTLPSYLGRSDGNLMGAQINGSLPYSADVACIDAGRYSPPYVGDPLPICVGVLVQNGQVTIVAKEVDGSGNPIRDAPGASVLTLPLEAWLSLNPNLRSQARDLSKYTPVMGVQYANMYWPLIHGGGILLFDPDSQKRLDEILMADREGAYMFSSALSPNLLVLDWAIVPTVASAYTLGGLLNLNGPIYAMPVAIRTETFRTDSVPYI